MGVVYRAVDLTLGRELALKFVSPGTADDPRARARLIREARLASSLNHPHICTVYDIGEFQGQVYIAFELISGNRLSDSIPSCGLPQKTVLQYGAQIADAIAHAHAHNILHRDLKSSNVVITPERQIKVLDFGLAQHGAFPDAEQNAEASTQSTLWAGTLQYSAPETLRGEGAKAASDIWSLGVVLHEMCSGRLPFSGRMAADAVSAILRDSPAPLPSNISRALCLVIEHCLQKEPGARFSSSAEVRAALEGCAYRTVIEPLPATAIRLRRAHPETQPSAVPFSRRVKMDWWLPLENQKPQSPRRPCLLVNAPFEIREDCGIHIEEAQADT